MLEHDKLSFNHDLELQKKVVNSNTKIHLDMIIMLKLS